MGSPSDAKSASPVRKRRRQRCSRPFQALVLFVTILILIYYTHHHIQNPTTTTTSTPPKHHSNPTSPLTNPPSAPFATTLPAPSLLSRPLSPSKSTIPKLLHQSWSTATLPADFSHWSHTCREQNPTWEHILWTNADNHALVSKHAPWFLPTYENLTSEIYRADAARNLYMHLFGGVYMDLDTECLRPWDDLFAAHAVETVDHRRAIVTPNNLAVRASEEDEPPDSIGSTTQHHQHHQHPRGRQAFLGRMGTDPSAKHSLPNAWMAGMPSHPFWLLPLDLVQSGRRPYGEWPEAVTGPDALFHLAKEFREEYAGGDGWGVGRLEDRFKDSKWGGIYDVEVGVGVGGKGGATGEREKSVDELVLLPKEIIYPYWWGTRELEGVCRAGSEGFDAESCKDFVGAAEKGSWSITYWSHSWGVDKGMGDGLGVGKEKEKEKGKDFRERLKVGLGMGKGKVEMGIGRREEESGGDGGARKDG